MEVRGAESKWLGEGQGNRGEERQTTGGVWCSPMGKLVAKSGPVASTEWVCVSVFVCEWHLVASQLERSDNGNAGRDQSLSHTLSFLWGDEIRQKGSLGILTFTDKCNGQNHTNKCSSIRRNLSVSYSKCASVYFMSVKTERAINVENIFMVPHTFLQTHTCSHTSDSHLLAALRQCWSDLFQSKQTSLRDTTHSFLVTSALLSCSLYFFKALLSFFFFLIDYLNLLLK